MDIVLQKYKVLDIKHFCFIIDLIVYNQSIRKYLTLSYFRSIRIT